VSQAIAKGDIYELSEFYSYFLPPHERGLPPLSKSRIPSKYRQYLAETSGKTDVPSLCDGAVMATEMLLAKLQHATLWEPAGTENMTTPGLRDFAASCMDNEAFDEYEADIKPYYRVEQIQRAAIYKAFIATCDISDYEHRLDLVDSNTDATHRVENGSQLGEYMKQTGMAPKWAEGIVKGLSSKAEGKGWEERRSLDLINNFIYRLLPKGGRLEERFVMSMQFIDEAFAGSGQYLYFQAVIETLLQTGWYDGENLVMLPALPVVLDVHMISPWLDIHDHFKLPGEEGEGTELRWKVARLDHFREK